MEPEKSILEVRNMFWPFSDSNIWFRTCISWEIFHEGKYIINNYNQQHNMAGKSAVNI
jgi:hypothetical protein